jgi:hypothetical protein
MRHFGVGNPEPRQAVLACSGKTTTDVYVCIRDKIGLPRHRQKMSEEKIKHLDMDPEWSN